MKIERLKVYRPQKDWVTVHLLAPVSLIAEAKKQGIEILIYNVCDHAACYKEVEAQAISYTAGVPAVATAILLAKGIWNTKTMVNVEELDPDPFLKLLEKVGLSTKVENHAPVAIFA